ncbi:MAG: PIN domain-containing protein [Candidatus Micrarchaeota archaeon]|nr:PIN domain-containing protein [Candidatus Micrarchaeota archaeon]
MKDKLFIDTNIICYAYDLAEPDKRKICEKILEDALSGEILGVVSNQVLGETFTAAVTKIKMPADEVAIVVKSLIASEKLEKVNYSYNTINRAASDFKKSGVPFWDLVMAETMKENGIRKIITENERDFGRIYGIEVVNPLGQ